MAAETQPKQTTRLELSLKDPNRTYSCSGW